MEPAPETRRRRRRKEETTAVFLFFLISSPFMGLFFLNAVFFSPLPLFFQSHTSPLPSLPLSLQKQIRDVRKTALSLSSLLWEAWQQPASPVCGWGGGEAPVPLAAAAGEISDEFQNLALLWM